MNILNIFKGKKKNIFSKQIKYFCYKEKNIDTNNIISPNIKTNSKEFSLLKIFLNNTFTNKYNGAELDLKNILIDEVYKRSDNENYFNTIAKEINKIFTEIIPKSSITIKIPKNIIYLTEYFLKENFYMHHCTENEIILCKWIKEKIEDKIPKYPHTIIGIGSVILTKNNKFLLIKENRSYLNKIKWKFVTGLNNKRECIYDTVKRETKEETNLNINIHGVIGFAEIFPSIYDANEMCFFQFCTIDKNEDDIKKELILDKDELDQAEFFEIEEVQKLREEHNVTIFTEKILSKILHEINKEKTLEENLNNLIQKNLILQRSLSEIKYENNTKSFKFYL
jgi:ADP-ribose pyrophosphatase YjhB (NUDIX family)